VPIQTPRIGDSECNNVGVNGPLSFNVRLFLFNARFSLGFSPKPSDDAPGRDDILIGQIDPVSEVRRTAWWADLGEESAGRGLHLHVHHSCPSSRVGQRTCHWPGVVCGSSEPVKNLGVCGLALLSLNNLAKHEKREKER
jgi:hypothetical protein